MTGLGWSLLTAFAVSLSAAEPLPLAPHESLAKLHVARGYEVELVAAEPLLRDPVAIDWDAAGRLWVVEMADYPLGMDGQGKPGGRVRLLEDSDGDGRYDKSTLFADELRFPTGIITWRDGVIVTAAPEILFLKDSDQDGRADVREVLFRGFLEGNQQLRINGLRYGLDHWIYCAAGGHYRGYAAETKIRSHRANKEIALGSRDFRFEPETGAFQPQSGPTQFGRNRDDWGHWFGTQNSSPLWHFVLADEYLQRNPHVPAPDPVRQVIVPRNPPVYPASAPEKRFHSFEHKGHFTSACSGMIYRDTVLFADRDTHAFVCEPFHNLVQHAVLSEAGVSFAARRAPKEEPFDFFASEDRWCRPVMARTGPDGALWVVDMYRLMIEHPDWLPEAGRKELLPIYRAGEDKGRIYRVARKGAARIGPPKLEMLDAAGLVETFNSENGWLRDKAQQVLLWREDRAAVPLLQKMARQSQRPLARLHALWTLRGLQSLGADVVIAALSDPHPGLRENALRLAELFSERPVISAAARLVRDPHPKVRLQLASTLGQWTDPLASAALVQLARADYGDPFIGAAIMSSARPHAEALTTALLEESGPAWREFWEPLQMLALAENHALLARLISPSLQAVNGEFTAAQMEDFAQFLALLNRRKISLEQLRSASGNPALGGALSASDALFRFARKTLASEARSAGERLEAARLLVRHPELRTETVRRLAEWISPRQPLEIQREAILAIAESGSDLAPSLLLANWTARGPEAQSAILEQLARRERWIVQLLERIQAGEIAPSAVDLALHSRLAGHESRRVRELAARAFGNAAESSRKNVIERYQPALALEGNPERGAGLFERLCINCHKHAGKGNEVGPDLRSVTAHPAEKLLANILDPSADVQPGFHAYHCTLRNEEEFYGIIAAETASSVVLKLSDGTSKTIARDEIASLRSSTASLMPEGLEDGLSPQQMADLIAFLKAPR